MKKITTIITAILMIVVSTAWAEENEIYRTSSTVDYSFNLPTLTEMIFELKNNGTASVSTEQIQKMDKDQLVRLAAMAALLMFDLDDKTKEHVVKTLWINQK